MQQDKHPSYRPVVFRDRSAGYAFLTRSTASSEQTIDWDDGNSYPVIDVEISAESHPFFTGKARVVDSEGQVAKFERRYGGEDASWPAYGPESPVPVRRGGGLGSVTPLDTVGQPLVTCLQHRTNARY